MKNYSSSTGITLIEVLVSITIILILFGIGSFAWSNARQSKILDTAVQSLVFKINEARSNAVAGKNGQNFGVKLNTGSYVYFTGSTYNSSDATNITYTLPTNISMTYTIPGPDYAVIFSRLTGAPQATGTVSVISTGSYSHTQTVTIGNQGDISVVK